jgi:hypothetical protein
MSHWKVQMALRLPVDPGVKQILNGCPARRERIGATNDGPLEGSRGTTREHKTV